MCEGLPKADFASLSFDQSGTVSCHGWKWMTWEGTLDIMHQRTKITEQREMCLADKVEKATTACEVTLGKLGSSPYVTREVQQILDILEAPLPEETPLYQRIPPKLVSNL